MTSACHPDARPLTAGGAGGPILRAMPTALEGPAPSRAEEERRRECAQTPRPHAAEPDVRVLTRNPATRRPARWYVRTNAMRGTRDATMTLPRLAETMTPIRAWNGPRLRQAAVIPLARVQRLPAHREAASRAQLIWERAPSHYRSPWDVKANPAAGKTGTANP